MTKICLDTLLCTHTFSSQFDSTSKINLSLTHQKVTLLNKNKFHKKQAHTHTQKVIVPISACRNESLHKRTKTLRIKIEGEILMVG